ncbi:DNA-directed DNA polymerase [Rhodophyticola sp. CCM32]|uniref:Y-family DNA polymerase n=1 Tax=Rhodophyticola sp. CCM32 TaxID=2916397 RepID=UPI00107F92E9|nr:DNA-directed DNA polymerase [Rhodophyticola sp. CCM32]QBY01041.1 DNA-directed DNA polymerase [Rhodophyticola sp. CCM32]
MSQRVSTLFFDMDSYFASVCQAEEPALIGRPVGVVTTDAPGAALIAASREAKICGIGFGTRAAEARRLCPDIVFRAAQHDVCVAYHHQIRDAVETVLPIHTAHSVDEFSCLLMGEQQELGRAREIGLALQQAIAGHVHPALTASVGVAPNKLLAKVVAEMSKPKGLGWITAEELPGKISHLPLSRFPGISKGVLARLDRAGIHDAAGLYALTPKAARHLWGNVEGARFLTQLQGGRVIYPPTRRSSLGHGQRLVPQNRTAQGARLVARRLLVKAASRLRREGLLARSLHISASCDRCGRQSTGDTMMATQDTFTLLRTFGRYWDRLELAAPRSVSVMLAGLVPMSAHMADLFEARSAGEQSRSERLCSMIDGLNARFGQDTVRFGELPPHKVPFTGAKIAFQRVPDRAEFHE